MHHTAIVLLVAVAVSVTCAKNAVMPWMCLERCGEDITSDMEQIFQYRDTLSAVSFEDWDLGYGGTLVNNGFTSVNSKIQAMGLQAFPMITTANLEKLRELFVDTSSFISDAVKYAVDYGYTGYNLDFEPEDTATNDDAISYAKFLTDFSNALHAQGVQVQVDIASWNLFWNFTLINETPVDKIITMDTYASSYNTFATRLQQQVALFGAQRLGVGFDNEYTMSDTEFSQRVALVESYKCTEIDIWQAPVGDSWWAGLQEFVDHVY
ncbi:hypothetical protein Pelo_10973 [Pelomyxa schiedti]|nr:hypothetical protein Pelo_10973 [Pelomyxa schiedti]